MTRNACPFCAPTLYKRADVGMREVRDGARFTVEAFAKLRVPGERVRQDLDRDRAIETGVTSLIHLPHPAGPERREDFVGAEEGAGL